MARPERVRRPSPDAAAAGIVTGLRWMANLYRLDGHDRAWDGTPASTSAATEPRATDPRLVAFHQMWADAVADLVAAVAGDAAGPGEIAAR